MTQKKKNQNNQNEDGQKKSNRGRPRKYTKKLAREICDAVASHDLSLREICDKYPHFPSQETIISWRRTGGEFSEMFRKAKFDQSYLMADNVKNLSDESNWVVDENGNQKIDSGYVQWKKLQMDARKWMAGRLAPRMWGNKEEELKEDNEQLKTEIQELRSKLDEKNQSDY